MKLDSVTEELIREKCIALEQEEINVLTPVQEELYVHLMLCYLYKNDLCNAKFLWKRIPPAIKEQSRVLESLWNLGRALWRKDAVAVHIALQAIEWPATVSEVTKKIQENYRWSTLELISRAYESLPLTDFANSLGLSLQEANLLVQQHGWRLCEPTAAEVVAYVYPKKIVLDVAAGLANQEQMQLLTNLVSFLEN